MRTSATSRSKGTWLPPQTMMSPGLVAEQRDELVVGHVEAEGLARVGGRAVNDEHAVPGLERQRRARRQLAEARDDELAELLVHLLEPLDARTLARARGSELARIDLRERAIADALNAQRSVIDQKLPDSQRIGAWKAKIATRDELIPAVVVRFLEHGFERRAHGRECRRRRGSA